MVTTSLCNTSKLISVYRDKQEFMPRQLPLVVEENLMMVLQFGDVCKLCGDISFTDSEFKKFEERFSYLNTEELREAFQVNRDDLFSVLSQLVSCVGCRRSAEDMHNQMMEPLCSTALDPLYVYENGTVIEVTVRRKASPLVQHFYTLLRVNDVLLAPLFNTLPKNRRNRRCGVHSLDMQRAKPLASWSDTWDVMSQECKEEVLLIDLDNFLETLVNYLTKHKFCTECKSKVLTAYNILVGDEDSKGDKGYCPSLYDGIKCCQEERHLHVAADKQFITALIDRSDSELLGSRRERHAKSLDVAQEEVLICLGVHLYERMHRLASKVRAEEQTWYILFYACVEILKRNFELAIEKKRGISTLELLCEEIDRDDREAEERRAARRQKKKAKKARTQEQVRDRAALFCSSCSRSSSGSPAKENGGSQVEIPKRTSNGCTCLTKPALMQPKNLCENSRVPSNKTGVDCTLVKRRTPLSLADMLDTGCAESGDYEGDLEELTAEELASVDKKQIRAMANQEREKLQKKFDNMLETMRLSNGVTK